MRIALISGASSGIGRALAAQLARREALDELWLISRHADALQALAASLPLPARCLPLDLCEEATWQKIRALLAQQMPQIHYLVLGAGVGYSGAFCDRSIEEAQRTVALNCTALTTLCHIALPYLVKGGHILTLASAAAFTPQPYFAVYAASKAYVLSFSRALGQEVRGRGICVTAVCPGPVDTPFLAHASPGGTPDPRKARYITDADTVARAALRAASRGRAVCTPTFAMRCARLGAKLLPHAWLMRRFR